MTTLYSAPSSYYSMIARLALSLAGIEVRIHSMDIHFRKEQLTRSYAGINAQLTVPALAISGRTLTDSRDILEYAVTTRPGQFIQTSPLIDSLVSHHYQMAIEQLTFGHLLSQKPLMRWLFPRLLGRIVHQLEAKAAKDPIRAAIYRKKIAQNLKRLSDFSEENRSAHLAGQKRAVSAFLAELPVVDQQPWLFGVKPSAADVVATVLLARLRMLNLMELAQDRPDLEPWLDRTLAQPACRHADIWTGFDIGRIIRRR